MNFKNILKIFLSLRDKEILNYAAALSFYTILSLIPLLFLCFYVFTQIPSFEMYQEKIKSLIFTFLIPTQQELIRERQQAVQEQNIQIIKNPEFNKAKTKSVSTLDELEALNAEE